MQTEWNKHVNDGRDDNTVIPVIEVLGEPCDPRFKWKETEWWPHEESYWLDNPDDN